MKNLFLSILVFVFSFSVLAQQTLKTTQLNVFKNGTYYIVKEGEVKITSETAQIAVPPQPLLGTLWLSALKDIKLTKTVFKTDTVKKSRQSNSFVELLSKNIGKTIKINYKTDEKSYRDINGTLLAYIKESKIIKIKSENKTSFYFVDDIRELTFSDKSEDNIDYDSLITMATIYFNKKNDQTRIRMLYMQSGIQWIPSYIVKIIDDKELQIDMKALVENYMEDISDAELTLTVGNPRFTNTTKYDPTILGYLTNLNAQIPMQDYSTAQSYAYANAGSNARQAYDTPIAEYNYESYNTTGEKTNDLYMYSLGKVSIPKNSKSSFEIFSQKVPYKDIYEVTINDVVNYSVNRYIANNPENKYDVFHSLKITNKTTNPFTTAPVFVLNEKLQPLAQDQIKYTSVNSEVSVQLARAGDIVVKNIEEEVKKEDNAKKVGKYFYNKITIKGVIQISNMLDKKINLNINKFLNALVNEASEGGKTKKPGKYYGLNPYSEINWEVLVNANEEKKITYQYEVYVLNQ